MIMNVEQDRLNTFQQWPNENPESSRLAKMGFYATGNGFEVQCHWCSSKIEHWTNADEVLEKHKQMKPTCPFLINTSDSPPLPLDYEDHRNLTNEQSRLATFVNWPITFMSPQSLAKAGFFYLNRSDHVRCAWCHGEIGKWEVGDNPFTEHLRFFPHCLWAQLGPNVEVSSEEPISDLGIHTIRAPKKERYSSLDARIRSFATWEMASIQSPVTLATAGFYYQNTDDQVRCFQCNGGLRSWQKEDDAWFEHARWFPKCEFVQLVKGRQYIEQVQQQSRPTLEDAMATEPVQKALEMGLSAGRVRAVTQYHLENFGSPFKCAETLIDAVLDYQRNEEGNDDNDDDEHNGSSSAIVREVGRMLDTIFKQTRQTPGAVDVSTTSASTSTSVPSQDVTIGGTNAESEPIIRLSDDHVVVEVPATTSNENEPNDNNRVRTPNKTTSQDETGHFIASNNFSTMQSSSLKPVPENSDSTNNSDVPQASILTAVNPAKTDTGSKSSNTSIKSRNTTEKPMTLEEENRLLKDARLCKVCMDGDVAVVFLPCGHLVTCVQCAPSVSACPLCRTAIKAFVRTFLS